MLMKNNGNTYQKSPPNNYEHIVSLLSTMEPKKAHKKLNNILSNESSLLREIKGQLDKNSIKRGNCPSSLT
jgi:hypothetical protein